MSKLTLIDLFCGSGGLSAGLERAGWSTVAAVDHDSNAIATLNRVQASRVPIPEHPTRSFLSEAKIICADIAQLTAQDLRPRRAKDRWRPDLLAGGPPCQPFSSAGLQRGLEDPRGTLFLEFVRLAAELQPRFILFENVPGLVTAKTRDGGAGTVLALIQQAFEDIGYACRFELLNAADYGAPQRRTRLFMFASLDRPLPDFPVPTHSRLGARDLFESVSPWVSLGEFLASASPPDPAEVVEPPERLAAALHALEPGTGLRTGGTIEANRPGGHWGYRQDGFLADPTVPARTIRTASTPDWIRLKDGSLRRLTVTECAGLQGFPDGWIFDGSLGSRFRQVGNAVQGHVAFALGCALRAATESSRRAQPCSAPWPSKFHRRVQYTNAEHAVNSAHRTAAKTKRRPIREDEEKTHV